MADSTQQAFASGWITDATVNSALQQDLQLAQQVPASGNASTAMLAYLGKVYAQSGLTIDPRSAVTLEDDARWLLDMISPSWDLPAITSVANAAGGQPGISPNTYVSIFGANFAPPGFYDDWSHSVVNGNLPTLLDGVSVKIGDTPAYISGVVSGQINVLVPNVGSGFMPVTVTTSAGASASFTVTSQIVSPAFFAWPNNQPVATHNDATGRFAVQNGTFPALTTIPAKPGEYISLWGTGFGPTNPLPPFGQPVPNGYYPATSPVTVTIGGVAAAVYNNVAVLSPGAAGEYQLGVQNPAFPGKRKLSHGGHHQWRPNAHTHHRGSQLTRLSQCWECRKRWRTHHRCRVTILPSAPDRQTARRNGTGTAMHPDEPGCGTHECAMPLSYPTTGHRY